ncbi:lytic transglycosylase domain-containing protein [Marinobacter sp.]|uniref:lytic transglycosylase domain-containing protein n=1 Tax=Marinobacter sp. TaxID=50741 RepID=UPI0025BF5B22|nr:lytic transglycosylase domain-containing protein [Marinobacter sp.]
MDWNRIMGQRIGSTLALATLIYLLTAGQVLAVEPEDDWTSVVRESPYWVSQGVFDNITTIRRWVLEESGYCEEPDRHILYDMRGRFLGYIGDELTSAGTQQRLNATRKELADHGKTDHWVKGSEDQAGYPFALACDQPHANLPHALDRYLGKFRAARLWGRWDDLSFATEKQPGSLHDALLYVIRTRAQQNRIRLSSEMPRYLAGQILIESSGQPRALSAARAKGILQLTPVALSDCNIRPANHWHRLAQIDCALRLTQQNARNLRPVFDKRFGHLPEAKQQRLFTLLLVQAYHGGAGRVIGLLEDETLSQPARYFASHHERFSAGDIAFGMIFHNLGRHRLGLGSLYYVADVQVATDALCGTRDLQDTDFCH